MEAYEHMNDLDYPKRNAEGANGWRRYAKMSIKERRKKTAEFFGSVSRNS
jgi:hypothetical protein